MKKITYTLAAIFASAFALTSCTKEMTDSSKDIESQGIPFEICASVSQTRTTTDNSWNTTWVAKDAINLFHAKAGTTTYVSDNKFTVENIESGKFKGTLAGTLDADSYDWYAFYPYSSYNKTPAGDAQSNFGYTTIGGTSQTQTGNNSQAHLCGKPCPLYGVVKSVSKSSSPTISMQQLVSVIEVNVTNNSGEDLTVSSVSFTGTEDIVGTFYINFTGTPVYTIKDASSVSETASLTVSEGAAIANGASAKFYLAIKPFTAASRSNLKLSVNGYEKTKKLTSDVTFAAGKIKTLNFDFDKKVDNYSGQYVAVVLKSGEYVYLTSAANGKRLATAKSGVSKITDYSTSVVDFPNVDSKYIWTIDRIDNTTYYTMCANALYIRKVATTDNYAYTDSDVKNAEPLDFVSGADGHTFTIKSTSSDYSGRILSVNTSNDYYAFYGNDGQLHEIVLIPYFTAEDTRTPLSTPEVIASLNEKDPNVTNSIDVMWDAVKNAGSYVVTATPTTGKAVSNTVTADESTTTYTYTITGLAYETEYTISVVAKPSNTELYKDSEPGVCADNVKTDTKPSTGDQTIYTLYETGFENDGEHTTTQNSYGTHTYGKWTTTYADMISNTSMSGSYMAQGRVAKNTTNSPAITSVNLLSQKSTITYVEFESKSPAAFTLKFEYSLDGKNWQEAGYSPEKSTSKTIHSVTFDTPISTDYFAIRLTFAVSAKTNNKRDGQWDNIKVKGYTNN